MGILMGATITLVPFQGLELGGTVDLAIYFHFAEGTRNTNGAAFAGE